MPRQVDSELEYISFSRKEVSIEYSTYTLQYFDILLLLIISADGIL